MELSPEERRRIYEEEKARIEEEKKAETEKVGKASTQIPQNVSGLLCYLAGWITGIIFLVIEPNNRFVRFHAIQSIVTFAPLMIATGLLGLIPVVGDAFSAIVGTLGFALWIILMIKAYQGEMFALPLAGDIATSSINDMPKTGHETATVAMATEADITGEPVAFTTETRSEAPKPVKDESAGRTGRIIGYSFGIAWNVALLIFFTFFHQYIAYYTHQPGGGFSRTPLLTGDYMAWLPIFIVVTVLTIAAYITLIIYDRYWYRETVEMVTNILGVVVVASLAAIFPFNFSVIPSDTIANAVAIAIKSGLILVAVVLGIAAFARFIKLIVYAVRQ
ncbi:MAG: hypothetical protein PHU18_02860 [Dehalococcoidales bacterium]|nr:hypothetical protein [Dehalococcoidales bacterium]